MFSVCDDLHGWKYSTLLHLVRVMLQVRNPSISNPFLSACHFYPVSPEPVAVYVSWTVRFLQLNENAASPGAHLLSHAMEIAPRLVCVLAAAAHFQSERLRESRANADQEFMQFAGVNNRRSGEENRRMEIINHSSEHSWEWSGVCESRRGSL